jgi:hypothetical protein
MHTYKPSALAYPPIVTGVPAPYPLTRPMGSYMTPSAIYAPHYVPVHAPRHAYGDARSEMLADMESDPLYQAPSSLFGVVAKGGTMLTAFTLFGALGAIVLGFGSNIVADTVLPPVKRSARTASLVNMGVNVATIMPLVVGVGLGSYGAYDTYMKYLAAKR